MASVTNPQPGMPVEQTSTFRPGALEVPGSGTSVQGGGNLVSGTTYASAANVDAAWPAASNSGKLAYVSPGVLYTSNSKSWVPAGAGTSENGIAYEYANGAVRPRTGFRRSRVLTDPTFWWTPAAPNTISATGTSAADTSRILHRASARTFTQVSAGFLNITYSGLNLAMPSNGLLVVPVFLEDYTSAGYSPVMLIVLTNASGSITYKYAGTALKPGWNLLPIWNPATDANAAMLRPTLCEVNANTGFNFAQNVTQIQFQPTSFAAGSTWSLAAVETMSKIKPVAVLTNDVTDTSTYTVFTPLLEAAGFRAGIRLGGFSDSSYTSGNISSLRAAYDNGHDVYNGSWSRTSLTDSTTDDVFAAEVLGCHNRAVSLGFGRGLTWFSTTGNSLPSPQIRRGIAPMLGMKVLKGPGGSPVNVCSAMGVDDPLHITATGIGGFSNTTGTGTSGTNQLTIASPSAVKIGRSITGAGIPAGTVITQMVGSVATLSNNLTQDLTATAVQISDSYYSQSLLVAALLYTGGVLVWFCHEFIAAANAQSSTSFTTEDFTSLVALLKTHSDAGNLEVVTPSQLDLIMEGAL